MSSSERIKSFKEFYPYYLTEHSKYGTRITHFIGTTLFFVFLIKGVVYGPWYHLFIGVICAYFFAWLGHFFIEKNKPATFRYPLWSLLADFRLYFNLLLLKESFHGQSGD